MTSVREIQQQLDRLAPPALAESWDNVGLLIGDPAQPVRTIVVALDATAGVCWSRRVSDKRSSW